MSMQHRIEAALGALQPAAAADAQPAACHNNNPQQPGQGGTANLDQVAEAFGQAADAFMNKMFGRR